MPRHTLHVRNCKNCCCTNGNNCCCCGSSSTLPKLVLITLWTPVSWRSIVSEVRKAPMYFLHYSRVHGVFLIRSIVTLNWDSLATSPRGNEMPWSAVLYVGTSPRCHCLFLSQMGKESSTLLLGTSIEIEIPPITSVSLMLRSVDTIWLMMV